LTRASIFFVKSFAKVMDCRVKPGNDDLGGRASAERRTSDCRSASLSSKRDDDAVERCVAIEQVHAF
jgi:hypothetical protein